MCRAECRPPQTSIASTLAMLLGIPPPRDNAAEPISNVFGQASLEALVLSHGVVLHQLHGVCSRGSVRGGLMRDRLRSR